MSELFTQPKRPGVCIMSNILIACDMHHNLLQKKCFYLLSSYRSQGWAKWGTDKSPLGQNPTRTKAHWTISHGTKAHCYIWQGGQKPTSLKKKNGLKSFIKLLTLIRLLLQGKSHMQCVFTDIIISPACCDKQLNLGVKSHWYLKKINLQFGANNLL